MIIIKFKTTDQNKISMLAAVPFGILLIVNFLDRKTHNVVLGFLGQMSYTFYITHLATLFLLEAILFNTGLIKQDAIYPWYLWIGAIFITIGCSCVFYLLAEKPSKKILEQMRLKND